MIGTGDQLDLHFSEERSALESIASVLMGAGSSQQRLDQALGLVQTRLQLLGSLFASDGPTVGGPGLSHSPVHSSPTPPQAGRPERRRLYADLIGDSPAMKRVHEAIHRVSRSHAAVLLRGESGTGKELVARAIHQQGLRASHPFVPLHCAAVSENLLESELFGHERGSFTGAVGSRKGRFESADGGTLFLDEIGDIPVATQVKLLRVLQDKCFERVGGNETVTVDVRVISATHRDLEAMVRSGAFREDLYYRLNVVPIDLPPLRERESDIALLIDHFLSRAGRENRRRVRMGQDLLRLMGRYQWPGNVRELQNCVERLVVMADSHDEHMTLESIPPSLRGYFADMRRVTDAGAVVGGRKEDSHRLNVAQPLRASLQEIERHRLLDTLRKTGWIQARTARALGLTARQVAYKMKKYGIKEVGEE